MGSGKGLYPRLLGAQNNFRKIDVDSTSKSERMFMKKLLLNVKKGFFNISAIYFAFYKGFIKPGSSWFILRLSAWSYWFRSWFRSGTRFGEFSTYWFRSSTRFGEFWTSWFRSGTRKPTFVCSLVGGWVVHSEFIVLLWSKALISDLRPGPSWIISNFNPNTVLN